MLSRSVRSSLPVVSALLLACFGLSPQSFAQINSGAASVTLNATLAETLTISATPANVNFTLAAGSTSVGSAPVAITSNWVLGPTRSTVKLYAWFATPTAALTDGASTPDNIPSSEVLGQMTSGTPTTYTAFTQSNTIGSANGGLLLFTQSLSSSNRESSRSDNLTLEINLSSQPQLPAGNYTGLLNLQAQAL
jgi:hypothetical protein